MNSAAGAVGTVMAAARASGSHRGRERVAWAIVILLKKEYTLDWRKIE
jgi:hypothetical protein